MGDIELLGRRESVVSMEAKLKNLKKRPRAWNRTGLFVSDGLLTARGWSKAF
jgi:hypothetical protein